MPLMVPGINSAGGGGGSEQNWMTKLAGKKIGDSHSDQSFAKSDLPQKHRIVKPDSAMTMDHDADRLNIHVGDDGTVRKVDFK